MVFVLMTFIGKKYDFLLGDSVKNISRNTIYLRLIVFICCKKKIPSCFLLCLLFITQQVAFLRSLFNLVKSLANGLNFK